MNPGVERRARVLYLFGVLAAAVADPPGVPGCDLSDFDGTALTGTINARIGTLVGEAPPLSCTWHISPNRELKFIEFNTSSQNFIGVDKLELYTSPSAGSGIIATFTCKWLPPHGSAKRRLAGVGARGVGRCGHVSRRVCAW